MATYTVEFWGSFEVEADSYDEANSKAWAEVPFRADGWEVVDPRDDDEY